MDATCSVTPLAQRVERAERSIVNCLEILSFGLAAALLAVLVQWVWRDTIAPHVKLFRRDPVEAVVYGFRIDEVRAGSRDYSFPRVLYRYEIDGEPFESAVVRHPNWVPPPSDFPGEAGGDETDAGEVRFYGPERQQRAQEFLKQYHVGQKLTAWVKPAEPGDAMLVRQEFFDWPFESGLIPGLFVPFAWMFFCGSLDTIIGRPPGRWIACGWAVLSLASFAPVCWQYRQLLGPPGWNQFTRLQDVGLGLAGTILVACLLPRPFRNGMSVGLLLSFTVLVLIGLVLAVFCGIFGPLFGLKLLPSSMVVPFLEFALIGGIILGLLLGLGAWRGVVSIRADGEGNPDRTSGCKT